ncbi:MAG: N-acetylmuramoyl-L-alanine amidase [Betaproteobacteria bacterium]|nr:N-acetylmuramoyl-L-alanine amidase [Betaproteobacteria bacterium]
MLIAACALAFGYSPSIRAALIAAAHINARGQRTRITLESASPLKYDYFTLEHPRRLVIDMQGVELNQILRAFAQSTPSSASEVKGVRVGQFTPKIVRLVLELDDASVASVTLQPPAGEYGYRLVVDLHHPGASSALTASEETSPPRPSPVVHDRGPAPAAAPIPVAMTAAHGGTGGEPVHAGRRSDAEQLALIRPHLEHRIVICIDPGHGGKDTGAIAPDGVEEKNITLAIARKLKALIDAQPNMVAHMTRNGNYFVPLGERVQEARAMKADLFISIHANSLPSDPQAHGTMVFALSQRGATDSEARWFARSENSADRIGGVRLPSRQDPYLAETLLDLSQTATIHDSLDFGKDVLSKVGAFNDLHDRRVEQANFAVLRDPDVPSILIETGFLTNSSEEHKLVEPAFQEDMARAILGGVREYLATNPPSSADRLAEN